MSDNIELKARDTAAENRSVVETPDVQERDRPHAAPYVLSIAAASQNITPWGVNPARRDRELRSFWLSESWLASVVYSVSIRNASFSWHIVGSDPAKPIPRNTSRAVQLMLNKSDKGAGWKKLMLKTCVDLYSQDNGAIWEIIRKAERPDAPVINIAHLDAGRCLSGDTRVLFEDGSTMSIREIVRHKYGGYVMSMSPSGELAPKRITNFYETSLGNRQWIKIRLDNPKRSFGRSESIVVTNDHEILTDRGWVRADTLRPEDKIATNYRGLSKEQFEVVVGTLLGDAFISRPRRKKSDGSISSLQLGHVEYQQEWLELKKSALKGFGWSKSRKSRKNFVSTASEASPVFGSLRKAFYTEGVKTVPVDHVIQALSPRMLATWFMDDGNKQTGKWGRPKGRLYTNNFTRTEVEMLAYLLNDYGIECSVQVKQKHEVKGKMYGPYYYIYITANGFEVLCKDIAAYIPPTLRYKLSEEAEKTIPYDESLWELDSIPYFDTISKIEAVSNGEQTAAFCVDVEDNHNFVAAGMVVHNCVRTGDPEYPIIYTDRIGKEHAMPHWKIRTIEEFPSPIESAFDLQLCAVSRALLAAEIIQSIAVYKQEKVGGTFTRALDAISGITKQNIDDAVELAMEQNLNQGLYRFSLPVIIAGVDPTSSLSHIHIDLASLPDNFDEDTSFKWYVAQLAAAFGVDYQEIAPLMTGNLGSSQQSEIMHLKTRGKGPALIMGLIEDIINDGLIPNNVEFRFLEHDIRSEKEKAEARFTRAKERSMRVDSGEIDSQAARQIAVTDGDLPEYLADELNARGVVAPVKPDNPGADQITGGVASQNEKILSLDLVDDIRKAISEDPEKFLQSRI